jgi:putative transposase
MVFVGEKTTLKSMFWRVKGYNPAMSKHYKSIISFSLSDEAKFRLEVIEHFNKFGLASTRQAYKVSRATVFRWRKKLKDSQGKLSELIPKRKTPINKRTMETDPQIISFIKSQREAHYRLGKRKIKPLLDQYCLGEGLTPISVSTIGKIIKRNTFFYQRQVSKRNRKIYHNPNSKWARRKLIYKTKVKKSPCGVNYSGYIEIDTVAIFVDGLKRYLYHAIDIKNKFDFAYTYKNLNSHNSVDFMKKLELVYPLREGVKTIQTDNGLEFLGDFNKYLTIKGINHLFIYPRCPKINSFIERANRTLEEEFVYSHLELLVTDLNLFNRKLMKHLVWYNTERVHESLNDLSPINYLLKQHPESQMYVTCTTN